MKPKEIISSKAFIIVLVVLLAILTNLKFRQWREQRAIEALKLNLQQQAAIQQKKNQELSDSINYINSTDFKEQVARQQLNLKRDGEIVYNFSQNNVVSTEAVQQTKQSLTNPQKWWQYFFGHS